MANYDSNYAIAQEISERIGVSPVPFDSVYSIALSIYQELGGTEENFDSVYSILLGILPLAEGQSSDIAALQQAVSGLTQDVSGLTQDVSGLTQDVSGLTQEIASKQDTLTAGQNITISGNTISADGYVFDNTNGNFIEMYRQDAGDGGQLVPNTIANTAIGSHAEGYGNSISGLGYGSHVEGQNCTVSGYISHAEGNATQVTGNCSHAEGNRTVASGINAHVEGSKGVASGNNSHAEGFQSTSSAPASHAEGYLATTRSKGSGQGNEGWGAHAEGWGTIAEGDATHAEGCFTIANGANSHAEGQGSETYGKNIAYGQASHVEGYLSQANNVAEHAEGTGNFSHTLGNRTSIDYNHSGVTISSIGIATSIYNKRNAREIMMNGDYYLYGVGNYDGVHIKGEITGVTVQTLQEVITQLLQSSLATQSAVTSMQSAITSMQSAITSLDARVTALEPQPTAPANNEIWYTTTDGQPLDLNNVYTSFYPLYFEYNEQNGWYEHGTGIVSNTYQNGKGVIVLGHELNGLDSNSFFTDAEEANYLTSISLPSSVTALIPPEEYIYVLDETAFYGQDELTEFKYGGTKDEFMAIYTNRQLGMDWCAGCSSLTTITCSDGNLSIDTSTGIITDPTA